MFVESGSFILGSAVVGAVDVMCQQRSSSELEKRKGSGALSGARLNNFA